MNRRISRILSIGALLVGAQFAAAVPAHAGEDVTVCSPTYTGDPQGCAWASATWISNGDKAQICDNKADGLSAVAVFWVNAVPKSNKWNTSGAGTCVERSWGDLTEGAAIQIQVCLGNYSTGTINENTCGYAGRGFA